MADAPVQETPTERGHKAVEHEVTAIGASQAINKEIEGNLGNPKANKEFLQAATVDLQQKGLLPEMAVDFGKKNFNKIDADKDGYASEAEIRRLLQKENDSFKPADRLAGNFLADQVGDQKHAIGYYKGFATQKELDEYKKESAKKLDEHQNGKRIFDSFGNEKDFAALDRDKNGYVSAQELKEKLAYNDLRLGEPDVGQKTQEKFERENAALKYMLDHQAELAKGNGSLVSNDLTLGSIRAYAERKTNPGLENGEYAVTEGMVRGSTEAEAEAKAKVEK